MGSRSGGDLQTAEHACDFLDPARIGELVETGLDTGLGCFLLHLDMCIGLRGDLGQMGDAQDLSVTPEAMHVLTDDFGDIAADTDIHFIEDDGRDPGPASCDDLQRQTDPRQFPAGGDAS